MNFFNKNKLNSVLLIILIQNTIGDPLHSAYCVTGLGQSNPTLFNNAQRIAGEYILDESYNNWKGVYKKEQIGVTDEPYLYLFYKWSWGWMISDEYDALNNDDGSRAICWYNKNLHTMDASLSCNGEFLVSYKNIGYHCSSGGMKINSGECKEYECNTIIISMNELPESKWCYSDDCTIDCIGEFSKISKNKYYNKSKNLWLYYSNIKEKWICAENEPDINSCLNDNYIEKQIGYGHDESLIPGNSVTYLWYTGNERWDPAFTDLFQTKISMQCNA